MTAALAPEPVSAVPTNIPAAAFERVLGNALVAADNDPSNPVLCSVFCRVQEGRLTVAATDRYRLLVEELAGIDGDWEAVINRDDVTRIRALMKAAAVGLSQAARRALTVRVEPSSSRDLQVTIGTISLTVTPVNRPFPDYVNLLSTAEAAADDEAVDPHLDLRLLSELGRINLPNGPSRLYPVSWRRAAKGRPVLFTVGSTIKYLVMPIRLAE